MKAAVLEKLNAPLVIEELEVPKLDVGQVLVQVHVSGICGAQLGEMSGAKGEDKYLPHLLGHEGSGVVINVGAGVTHIKRDDHVVMHWRKGIGIESACPKYRRLDGKIGMVGGGWVTTFNEYAVVSENRLTPIDKDIPFNVAALMGCAITTGFGLINNEAKLKLGQSIAVAGVGGVGLYVIQGARMVGGNPIIAIDIWKEKLDIAKKFGATYVVRNAPEWSTVNVDISVDCTGDPEAINRGLESVKPGGKMILVGQPRDGVDVIFKQMRQHYCGKTILDSQGGLTNPTADIPRYLKLYRKGKFSISEGKYFTLDTINDGMEHSRTGSWGRPMLMIKEN